MVNRKKHYSFLTHRLCRNCNTEKWKPKELSHCDQCGQKLAWKPKSSKSIIKKEVARY
jgi:rRNA maturation endonuclease Nob1